MRRSDLEADLAAAVPQAEKTPELLRVDKQLMAAQEDDPWGTGPAMRDWPAVQEERGRCAARPCYWSGDAGPGVRGSGMAMALFLIGGHWLKILPQNPKGAS